MGQLIANFFSFLRQNALKIVATLGIAIVFFIVLFPAEDLSDVVTSEVAKRTGIYFQSDRLELNFIPSPGLVVENALIENGALPPIKASYLEASISPLKAIMMKIGASVSANGLFGGDLVLNLDEGDTLKSGDRAKLISLAAEKLNLELISDYMLNAHMSGAMALQGLVNLSTNLVIDTVFQQQPKGSINLDINSFTIPGQTMMVPFNGVMVPQPMPEMKFGKLALKGELNDGNLDIQNLSFGAPGSDFSGKIKGQMGMQLRPAGGGVQPVMGRYDLMIDFTIGDAFYRSNQSLLEPLFSTMLKIDNYKQPAPNGTRYVFRIRPDMYGMPQTSTP